MSKTVTIGSMRHKATFHINTPWTFGAGDQDYFNPELLPLTTRGYLENLSGGRIFEAEAVVISNKWRFTTRYSSRLAANLNSTIKVVIDGRNYTVDTFKKIGQREFYYEIMLNETEV